MWKEYIVGKKTFDDITTLSEIGEKGVIDKLPSEVTGYEYEFTYNFWLWLDLPILENPNWLSVDICTKDFLQYMWDAEYFMKENSIKNTSSLIGFADFEIEKFQRNIRYMEDKIYGQNNYIIQRKNFISYIDQLDKRRNTNFLKIFPEYKEFYNLCKQD